ncbi:MAG: DUF4339 domain-containing protein [Polyangiales bacterium]
MWYLQRRNTRAIGPVPTDEVIEGIKSGEIPRDTMVCAADSKQWLPIDAVPELAGALVGKPARASSTSIELPEALDGSRGGTPEKPRPRIIRRVETMPEVRRARAALAVSGAALALSVVARLVVFAPTPALAALLDTVHALRSTLIASGALGVVAWGTACVATYMLEHGRIEARSLARAGGVPFAVSFVVSAIGLVTVGRGLASLRDVSHARTMLLALTLATLVAAFAWAALIGRALVRGIDRQRDAIAIACVAVVSVIVTPAARAVAAVTDVFTVDGPLFSDDATLRKHVESLRAGASGVAALDETLGVAIFVPKATRVRYLDELVVEARGGAFVARKVLLEGGRTAFVQR